MSTFGKRCAFGEQVISDPHGAGYVPADNYGFSSGLTIEQHVYIQMVAAVAQRGFTLEEIRSRARILTETVLIDLEAMQ